MTGDSLYNHDRWLKFCERHGKTEKEFKLKTYPQFDPPFNFFKEKDILQTQLSDLTLKSIAQHSFIPFVKILTKTPKYRYQENEGIYDLETKIRPISFASHYDTYIYGYYTFALTDEYQTYIRGKGFSDCVFAYRTDLDGKCNIQFAKEVFDQIDVRVKHNSSCTAIAFDISGYFDNIDHSILKEKWCKIIEKSELPIDQYKIYRTLTKYAYVHLARFLNHFNISLRKKTKNGEKWFSLLDLIPDALTGKSFKEKFELLKRRKLIVTNLPKLEDGKPKHRGIPQGSAMSSVLSNIYLVDFDEWMHSLSEKKNATYRRYCDDLIVVCNTADTEYFIEEILKKIKEYHLCIQDKKTDRIDFLKNSKGKIRSFNKVKIDEEKAILSGKTEQRFYKNLQYLGFEYNGENIYIRPGSLSRYFRKLKARVIKTTAMAYSNASDIDKILKRQIFNRYSHLGKRNFLSYIRNAAKKEYKNAKAIVKDGMNSISIKRQLASHMAILKKEILQASLERFKHKQKKAEGKIVVKKRIKPVKLKY